MTGQWRPNTVRECFTSILEQWLLGSDSGSHLTWNTHTRTHAHAHTRTSTHTHMRACMHAHTHNKTRGVSQSAFWCPCEISSFAVLYCPYKQVQILFLIISDFRKCPILPGMVKRSVTVLNLETQIFQHSFRHSCDFITKFTLIIYYARNAPGLTFT